MPKISLNVCPLLIESSLQLSLNEADTPKSSSMLIYSRSEQSLYTQSVWHYAALITGEIKMERVKLINKVQIK